MAAPSQDAEDVEAGDISVIENIPLYEIKGAVPETRTVTISERITTSQERARFGLAWTFVLIFAATILGATTTILFVPDAWAQEKELLQLLLPAETALLGSAVGFYFGTKA
jgi:hypothetical protein